MIAKVDKGMFKSDKSASYPVHCDVPVLMSEQVVGEKSATKEALFNDKLYVRIIGALRNVSNRNRLVFSRELRLVCRTSTACDGRLSNSARTHYRT